ncbi:TetR/AcrR family transcriptional regulator [Microbacterium amylolyticum]|uniref:AcrR family transcriptional regulator n=1 Tax=Microbacterium amylolyticum TaxID=936337 RepID=A0ABS4ZG01_9MICO|nr:TetR/AcrR family transcriptional regulator [Microbacterium amylolyticum]MBP2436206.1 AcrR family transcriptional regulator [Microbacterium amylolyticum]
MSTSESSYHHGHLADALLDAADELLAERGAAALSLREVARRAGVSHNAPYHHFADRTALVNAVARRHMARLLEAQRAAWHSNGTPRERLRAMGEAYVRYAHEYPNGFDIVFDPEVCSPTSPSPGMAPLIRENELLLDEAIRTIFPEQNSETLVARAAGFWAACHGVAVLSASGHMSTETAFAALDAVDITS